MRRLALLTSLLCLAASPAALAASKTTFTVRGAGFGHGIGLSQYGAYGYAVHGASYNQIVLHYYKGTHLENVGGRTIRVLLQSGPKAIWFSGVTQAAGTKLDPTKRYRAVQHGIDAIQLQTARGKKLATAQAPLVVQSSRGYFTLLGRAQNGVANGSYRGTLELRPGLFGGMMAVNALPLDDYVQGVVPGEVPTSWPPAVLAAQAVVARSYSLVTDAGGALFDQYADTRSQMYTGMQRETPGTNVAVRDTSGQVVAYGSQIATTFYFSTSGGETENIENVFIGHSPVPYLKAVDDPYDTASPLHRWRFRWTSTQLDRKLGSWVKGRLRGVRVVQRGVSPRIVLANVNGTRGTTQVTGPQLRTRLGLYDTWAYFIAINSGQQKDTSGGGSTGGGGSTTGGGGTTTTGGGSAPNSDSSGLAEGGATTSGGAASAAMYTRPNWMRKLLAPRRAQRPRRLVLSGTILPRAKRILIQELRGGHWVTFGSGHTDRRGRYALRLGHRGVYRILANAAIGPAVSIR